MDKEKLIRATSYALLLFFVLTFLTMLTKEIPLIQGFFRTLEVKSLDFRETILASSFKEKRIDNSKVALIVIDDDSMEKLTGKYGSWPWNRTAYSDVIKYLEKDGADTIFLDLMFLGFQQGNEAKDWIFINELKKHKNVYLSLNFDFRENEKQPELPLELVANLDNKSDIDFRDFTFTNVRGIMPEIMAIEPKVAFINFQRDVDGISRRAPSFFIYKEKYYPYAALKIVQDYMLRHKMISSEKFIISQDYQLTLDNKKYKLDKEGYLVLNWHNKSDVTEIPYWKVLNGQIEKGYFKDKIVAVGTSAVSLADTKNTPIDRYLPGVKIHTTYMNNLLNNTSIIPAGFKLNLIISFIFLLIYTLLLFKINSNIINGLNTIVLIGIYFALSLGLLAQYNIWIDLAYPIFLVLATYTTIYVIKFIRKSQDFEKTYKLATTDGLTELYNHRYFQEQMLANIDSCKRYKNNFSLILIDIDFFKKFNDKFGHQAGDDVLRQVAAILKKSVRASDIVARYGGEEMAIILTNTNLEDAKITAQKICKAVADQPFKLVGGIECRVTISLGVSTYPMHGTTAQELIEISDKGLYNAKENGRNQVGKVPNMN